MNITIRRAIKEDWKIIQKLNSEVFEDNLKYDKLLDLDWPSSSIGVKRYKQLVTSAEFCTFIAFDGDIPVGHVIGGLKDIDYRKVKTAEIIEMGVSPTHRSVGIGSRLVTKLKIWAKKQGYQTLMVNTHFENERAIGFYKKQGLLPIDLNLEMPV